MYISAVKKIVYVAVHADGMTFRVWADGDVERPVWYDGYRTYEIMDHSDRRYAELVEAAKAHWSE